jgi:hypothetical protein
LVGLLPLVETLFGGAELGFNVTVKQAVGGAKTLTEQASTVDWVKLDGLADWFDCSTKTMRRKLPELYAQGFPHPNPALDKWYLPRCKEWAREESFTPTPKTDPLMRALDGHRRN